MSSSDNIAPASSLRKRKQPDVSGSDDSIVNELNPNDVLLGRGQHVKSDGGNHKFRTLVRASAAEYHSSQCKTGKDAVARRIISVFHADGGRFVRRKEPPDNSALDQSMLPVYELADEATVLVKVNQTMRDYSVILRKAAAAAANRTASASNGKGTAEQGQAHPSMQLGVDEAAAIQSGIQNIQNQASIPLFSNLERNIHNDDNKLKRELQQQQRQQQIEALEAALLVQQFHTSRNITNGMPQHRHHRSVFSNTASVSPDRPLAGIPDDVWIELALRRQSAWSGIGQSPVQAATNRLEPAHESSAFGTNRQAVGNALAYPNVLAHGDTLTNTLLLSLLHGTSGNPSGSNSPEASKRARDNHSG